MKIRLPWHPDKYVNQLHYDGASIFHNISTKMQNLSFAADVDDYLLVSLCQNLYNSDFAGISPAYLIDEKCIV